MSTMELNTDIYRSLTVISDDESYLKKAAAFLKNLAKEKEDNEKMSAYEQSLLDIEQGNINHYNSAEEFFQKMGI